MLEPAVHCERNAQAQDSLHWSDSLSEGSPLPQTLIPKMIDGDEEDDEEEEEGEERHLNLEDQVDESLQEMDMAYRLARQRDLEHLEHLERLELENGEWLRAPSPASAAGSKLNGIHLQLSPAKPTDEPPARRSRLGSDLHAEETLLGYGGRPAGLLMSDEFTFTQEPSEDGEEDQQNHHHQQQNQHQHHQQQQARLEPSWGPGLAVRPLSLDRARLNLSLLEQAMLLQSEQRQALQHAYKDMDRFLLEQMSGERRHQRMLEMSAARAAFHGCKGAFAIPRTSTPSPTSAPPYL